jgi:hypothetical protein
MDLEPWTYRAMAAELLREGRMRPWAGPTAGTLGDPRDYLFVELDVEVGDRTPGAFAIGVRLFGDERLHRSDAGRAELACAARGPLRTAVRLPPGSRPAYIAELHLCRAPGSFADVAVSRLMEAFMLNDRYLPERMEIRPQEPVRLRPERPTELLWSRLFDPDLSFEERP